MTKTIGQPCENGCGGKYVQNPKTGKVFCENKCWLNNANSKPVNPGFAQSTATNTENANLTLTTPKKDTPDWDRISFGKCKYGFMVEIYKKENMSLDDMEKLAEDMAKRAMRVLEQPKVSPVMDELDQSPF